MSRVCRGVCGVYAEGPVTVEEPVTGCSAATGVHAAPVWAAGVLSAPASLPSPCRKQSRRRTRENRNTRERKRKFSIRVGAGQRLPPAGEARRASESQACARDSTTDAPRLQVWPVLDDKLHTAAALRA